ncbi:MAG: sigma-70 family RNA polymerase sigma factor [Chloroflexi bacterium]|nr:sigma-70 family RNA polymerase sigma factor [Chloroflexota bacterium]
MNTTSVTNPLHIGTLSVPVTGGPTKTFIQSISVISAQERKCALQEIYDAHIEQIYKFIYFKVGNREDAEDITSQVFIKASNSLDVTQAEHTRLAWLYQVARTSITDHWRSYYRGPVTSLEELEEHRAANLADKPLRLSNDDIEETNLAGEKIRAILEMLPQNYRRVLQLRFLEGCSLRETAQAMQITESNAKVMQHRALQKAVKLGAHLVAA